MILFWSDGFLQILGSAWLRWRRLLAGHGVRAQEPDTVFQTQAVMVDQMSKGLVATLTEKENKFSRDSV